MHILWVCKKFHELTLQELYAVMQLRIAVFVVEQKCVFQDADNKDEDSYHFMGWGDNGLVAYSRLLPPGVSYNEVSIGRVVTSPQVRKNGIGKELMRRSISACYTLFGKMPIKIGAQFYLKNFYESLGFHQSGDVYSEDGIDHVQMELSD